MKIGEIKKKLRKKLLANRRALLENDRKIQSEKICQKILFSENWKKAEVVVGFMPMADEVQIQSVLESAISLGKKVVLPVVSGENLEWREVNSLDLDKNFSKGPFGIWEPLKKMKKWSPQFDKIKILWLVPGVGFDKNGNRLGMGSGFYDRTFVENKQVPGTIGVAFPCQIVERVPTKGWDVSVEKVILG